MFLYNGEWSRGINISEKNTIEGSVELKDEEILVNFEGKMITDGTILSSKINEDYISVYCNNFLVNGVGNARFGLVSLKDEDIKIVSEVDREVITEVKFNISNLHCWLGGNGLSPSDNGKYKLRENIEIDGENIFIETIAFDDEESIGIKTIPFVNIVYSNPVSIQQVDKDISTITKFFAILIGRVDNVREVWIKLESNDYYSRYFTSTNNSHMKDYECYKIFNRTKYKELPQKLSNYYIEWCRLYDECYIVMEHFFKLNLGIPFSYEDMFLGWCNIFDGYLNYKNQTDIKTNRFKKEIKKILKKEEIAKEFRELFKNFGLKFEEYKVADKIKKELEQYQTLGEALQGLFRENYDLISKNIEDLRNSKEEINEENIYEYINDTRNYYTHLKQQKKKVLNNKQMSEMNKLFCSTFIIIILKEIGFKGDELKDIIDRDDIIHFHKR